MKKTFRIAVSIIILSNEWMLLYFGVFGGHKGLGNVLAAWAVIFMVLSLLATVLRVAVYVFAKESSRKERIVTSGLSFWSRIILSGSLFYAGWFWTGSFLLIGSAAWRLCARLDDETKQ